MFVLPRGRYPPRALRAQPHHIAPEVPYPNLLLGLVVSAQLRTTNLPTHRKIRTEPPRVCVTGEIMQWPEREHEKTRERARAPSAWTGLFPRGPSQSPVLWDRIGNGQIEGVPEGRYAERPGVEKHLKRQTLSPRIPSIPTLRTCSFPRVPSMSAPRWSRVDVACSAACRCTVPTLVSRNIIRNIVVLPRVVTTPVLHDNIKPVRESRTAHSMKKRSFLASFARQNTPPINAYITLPCPPARAVTLCPSQTRGPV